MSRVAHRWSQGVLERRLAGLGGPPPDGRFIGAPTAATPQCTPQGSSGTCSPTPGSGPSCAPTASTAPSLSTTSSAIFGSMKANFRAEGGLQSGSLLAFCYVPIMLFCTSFCNIISISFVLCIFFQLLLLVLLLLFSSLEKAVELAGKWHRKLH